MTPLLTLLATLCGDARPLTPLDALHALPWTPGRVVHYGDWNGDGVPDVAMVRQPPEGTSIEVLCGIEGQVLLVLWAGRRGTGRGRDLAWDLGDIDGDPMPDLVLGLPDDSTGSAGAGAVLVVSGATAQVLSITYGGTANERYGAAVAFVGDLDGDGRGDYCVGSAGHQLESWDELRRRAGVSPGQLSIEDHQRILDARTEVGGWVSARSGRDHGELWRRTGGRPGHGFASTLCTVGDLDRDCRSDLVVGWDVNSTHSVTLLSGLAGAVIGHSEHRMGPVGGAGDLDGDGVPDLFLDSGGPGGRGSEAWIVSGATLQRIGDVTYPDIFGDTGVTVGVGDLDGDGFDDVAVGEPNYNLLPPESGPKGIALERLQRLAFDEALRLQSNPRSMMSSESGCLLVVSGRTRRPIWGVWGRPGTHDGIGSSVCAIPDVSGDGAPDLVVGGADGTFVFAGPGRSHRMCR